MHTRKSSNDFIHARTTFLISFLKFKFRYWRHAVTRNHSTKRSYFHFSTICSQELRTYTNGMSRAFLCEINDVFVLNGNMEFSITSIY